VISYGTRVYLSQFLSQGSSGLKECTKQFSSSASQSWYVSEYGFLVQPYGQQSAHQFRKGEKEMRNEFNVGKATVRLVRGDITEMETDAIVNAANRSLMGGGGVDGAIHRKGGPKILEECKKIRATEWPQGLPTGKAVITGAGNLKTKHVIHTVGPVWRGGNRGEPELLAQAYQNSLRLAVAEGLKTVAFPSISTGAYGYPVEKACHAALNAVKEFLEKEDNLSEVVFVLFSESALEVYADKAEEVF
jgi:O-acetyl-ADP-ribose deacetylase (regulator of RNase III)